MPQAAAPIIGGVTGLLGAMQGGSSPQYATPPQMQGTQQNAINYLNAMLGMNPFGGGYPAGSGGGGGSMPGTPMQRGQGEAPGGYQAPGGFNLGGGTGGGFQLPNSQQLLGNIQNVFGNIGVGATPLQQQASGGMQQFLGSNGGLNQALQAYGSILGQQPGAQMNAALMPFEQSALMATNGQGPRFSSGNDIAKTQVGKDYALMAAQNAQQGQAQQLQAAQQMLQSVPGAYSSGYGMGQQQAAQADIQTQRQQAILQSLLQTLMSAGFQMPISNQPNTATNLGQWGTNMAGLLNQYYGNQQPAQAGPAEAGSPGMTLNTSLPAWPT